VRRWAVLVVSLFLALGVLPARGVPPSPHLITLAKTDRVLAARLESGAPESANREIDAAAVDRVVVTPNQFGVPTVNVQLAPATRGQLRTLAILVDFPDRAGQVAPTSFDSLLFADTTGPSSLRGYFKEVSYGQLSVTTNNLPSSVGWVTLPQNAAYYAGTSNGTGMYPKNSQKMVADAVALVDGAIDFSVYDNDHDGFVDNLIVVHAGRGAEYSGAKSDIWSHSWSLDSHAVAVDGVTVNDYTTEPEYWATRGDMTTGVFAHEMGHTLGLPDLYDTTPSSNPDSEGIGDWSLMAGGSWNGRTGMGDSAARPDAWCMTQLGWVAPITLVRPLAPTAIPTVGSSSSGTVYKVYPNGATSGSEYFLFENRQKTGTDSYLPGSGLLVWHVDETQLLNGNDDVAHKLVDLEEADGLNDLDHKTNRGDTGDPYPGKSGNTAFFNSTTPDSRTYSGAYSNVAAEKISSSRTTMTADIGLASLTTFALNYAAGAGGTLTGIASQTVTYGASGTTVTAVPDQHHHFVTWSDGVLTAARREVNVAASKSVTASFAVDTLALKYTAGAGGSISGIASQTVAYGSSGTTVTASPDIGHHFVSWSDGVLTAARREVNVTASKSVTASFSANTFTLRYAAGAGGTLSGVASQTVAYGSAGTSVTAAPDIGYHFVRWSDGVLAASRREVNVTASKSVTASFSVSSYALVPTWNAGGIVSPSGTQTVAYRSPATTFSITPYQGNRVADVQVDGVSVGPVRSYVFDHVEAGHMLEVTFEPISDSLLVFSTASNSSLPFGSAFTIGGALTTSGRGIVGASVVLQSRTPDTSFVDSLSTTTSVGGHFAFRVLPTGRTLYRVCFSGAGDYLSSQSTSTVYVWPRAWVSTPIAPASMSRQQSSVVHGYLRPWHRPGTYPVRIYRWKRTASGSWRSNGYVSARATNYGSYTKYSQSVRLTTAGRWRIRAYAVADKDHAAAWSSGYDYIAVR
jgi:M6 family metalloprotease-like protein